MSIKDYWDKIKPHEQGIKLTLIIILSTTLAFGLGRLSKIEVSREPIRIEESPIEVLKTAGTAPSQSNTEVTASKKGTRYYYAWCSGGQKIKAENKITFAAAAAAEAGGYTLASNCAAP